MIPMLISVGCSLWIATSFTVLPLLIGYRYGRRHHPGVRPKINKAATLHLWLHNFAISLGAQVIGGVLFRLAAR